MLKVIIGVLALALAPQAAVEPAWMPAAIFSVQGTVVSTIVGGVQVQGLEAAAIAAAVDPRPDVGGDLGGSMSKGATLSTTVHDPDHPGEDVTIVTIQGAAESDAEFIERHMTLVARTRKWIKDHAGK